MTATGFRRLLSRKWTRWELVVSYLSLGLVWFITFYVAACQAAKMPRLFWLEFDFLNTQSRALEALLLMAVAIPMAFAALALWQERLTARALPRR